MNIRMAVSLGLLLTPLAAGAHHSVGAFYVNDDSSEMSGAITSVDWVNPHIRFTLDTINDQGESEVWTVESGSVNMLERNGVSRERLVVGNEVTVIGRLSRLGQNGMYASSIRTPDGGSVVFRSLFGEAEAVRAGLIDSPEASSGTAPDSVFRVWTRGRAYAEGADNSPTGLALPYTPAAAAAREAFDPLTDDTALQCIQQGMPGIMDNPFPIEFVAQGDDILLRLEEWAVERTIHLNGSEDRQAQPASRQGDSVGRWDGGTLVVTTTGIDWPFFDDVGTPQSVDVETVEQFSLSDGGNRLNYTITVTDRATFTEPITLGGYWVWVPGQEIKPFGCTLAL